MQKEKVRVYLLARELNIDTKILLDMCQRLGFDVRNQLSSLDPEQRDVVEQMIKKGAGSSAPTPAGLSKPAAPVIPVVTSPVRNLSSRPARREVEPAKTTPPSAPAPPAEIPTEPGVPRFEAEEKPFVTSPAAKLPDAPKPPAPPQPSVTPPRPPDPGSGKPPEVGVAKPLNVPSGRPRDLSQTRSDSGGTSKPAPRKRDIPRPTVARVAPLPPLKPRPADPKKAQEPVAQKPIARLPEAVKGGTVNVHDLLNRATVAPDAAPSITDDEEDASKGRRPAGGGGAGVAGRDKRHQQRNERAKLRKDRSEDVRPSSRALLSGDDDRPQRVKQRLRDSQKKRVGPTQPRKGRTPIALPITVRSLSEAVGIRSGDLLMRLMNVIPGVSINSTIEPEVAEATALDLGCELEVKRVAGAEEQLLASSQAADQPEDLNPRAPIVTIMGHVDHGKTSLLDRIRRSNVAATEAGGITQVIRAWRVDHGGHPITFLDTPGHEAFTKMRARGAQVTDIAVIVVAADDGVMPQTEEAINHAKAAGVPVVVAINKVDLPSANLNKTRQQLYGLNVLPDNMGGDTPFVETSASTGKGVDELLDTLSLVAETLLELKANPKKAAAGTCLEAMLSEGEGVRATLLVQEGTLHKGDVVLCGASYGRVRAMYDDLGRPIDAAGPSVPVRITGLDDVPNADDPFIAVDDLAAAREVADVRKDRMAESTLFKRAPARLEDLGQIKIVELKVILKADFRGSIEAIRKEMEKLQHEEVRVRVLHTGIGGITESDVQLALTSPQDTIIVGFNVVPDDRARALAEEKGVQIREYDVIYHLTDDIRSALEGKLKPREEIVHLGRAVVRNTFKISRVGTIAGCYVTQGLIERSAKVRLIREGVVIYPPTDRTVGLDSLKRFKDDAREVREGFECGIKIAGYDDVKVGDVIEAYRVDQVLRTL